MTHKTLLLILLLFGLNINAQEINWMTFNEAIEAQKKEPKKILVDFYTSWCHYCKKMDKRVFSNQKVAEYLNENYYSVKFNAEGMEEVNYKGRMFQNINSPRRGRRGNKHPFAQYLGINGYPALVYFDEEANLIGPIPGYKSVKELEIYLKMFANDDHKKIADAQEWQSYQDNFKFEFGR